MSDFASILASIAHNDTVRARPATMRLGAHLGEALPDIVCGAREAARAYAAQIGRTPADSVALPDIEAMRGAIAKAGSDARRLRALRRLAARALHPDRGGDGAALAECNALIDDALRTSRRRT